MQFITEYTLKPHMSKAEVKRLMDIFGKRGAGPGETAHYIRLDSTGGWTISDNEDAKAAYESALAYTEFMTFTVTPVQLVDDAVGSILAYIK